MTHRGWLAALLAAVLVLVVPVARADSVTTLVDGTAVLLSQTSGGGGNGGNTSSTSSMTNIFSPAAFVDYKRFGGEPTAVVDRYPIAPGKPTGAPACPPTATTTCAAKDIVYASSPNGFVYPHYSPFWKSDDLGQTFRVPQHLPSYGETIANVGGGGDSHIAVGQRSHRVFFVDLPGPGCVTSNTSDDLGESWKSDPIGCGLAEGAIDDRQWVDVDESGQVNGVGKPCPPSPPNPAGSTLCNNAYISFINFTNAIAPTLSMVRSFEDGNPGTFATDSTCTFLGTVVPGSMPVLPSNTAGCPDPVDSRLQVAGPVTVDKSPTSPYQHSIYIPFARGGQSTTAQIQSSPPWDLWVAISRDGGNTWEQREVAVLGAHNPVNLFPQLTIDTGGNLYYTWSQTMGPGTESSGTFTGEQDVFYKYSTTGGETWTPTSPSVPPNPTIQQLQSLPLDGIDLTKENNDSAIMPWMVAGDPGNVDLVYYKANTGLNSNVAALDENGNPCTPTNPLLGIEPCARTNPTVWNVYFAQAQNALNTGPNFKSVQISDHPNHIGQVCTSGVGCDVLGGNRNLLDFFTVDVDHLGAANVIWADDNNNFHFARNKFSRQLSGNSVFKNTNINLQNDWPITDHAVTDRAGDVFDGAGLPKGSCPGMDILGASAQRSGTLLTVSLQLNNVPSAAEATACSPDSATTGGLWGVRWWSASAASATQTDDFYAAYRDNPTEGPRVEAGRMDDDNVTITSTEFDPQTSGPSTIQSGFPGGTCIFPGPMVPPATNTPCTITFTVDLAALGIKSGDGLYSVTPLSVFFTGRSRPSIGVSGSNSEQADAGTAFDVNGTGTTK